jgi:hypothetical protein
MTIPTRRQHGVARAISLRFRAPHLVVTHPLRTVKVMPAH